ncbi:hypothetical protein [Shewanella sp. S23-S33]|uniref:hypothetical protein n=1 Tax=Shewanella sp. S23-S33 TaxID=3342769 RepID=UPI00372D8637
MNIENLLTNLEREVKSQKILYVGNDVFEMLHQHLGIIYGCTEVRTATVKFIKVMAMDSRGIATEDPELAAILDKIFERNRIGDE